MAVAQRDSCLTLVRLRPGGHVDRMFDLPAGFRLLVGVRHDSVWTAGKQELIRHAPDGKIQSNLTMQEFEPQQQIGSVVLLGNRMLLTVDQLGRSSQTHWGGNLLLISQNHELVWGSSLPAGTIDFPGCVKANAQTRFHPVPKPPWKPKNWVTPSGLLPFVSGDCVYAAWYEFPQSGIGRWYAIDLANGHPHFSTGAFPISQAFSAGDGNAVLSYGGYGHAATLVHGPGTNDEPAVSPVWNIHGRVFQSKEGQLYCVEMNPGKREQSLCRLEADGQLVRIGPPMTGYETSQPKPLGCGHFCFWKGNRIWLFDPEREHLYSPRETAMGPQARAEAFAMDDNLTIVVVRGSNPSASRPGCQIIRVYPA